MPVFLISRWQLIQLTQILPPFSQAVLALKKWLPLLDLFRNHKLEFVFNFTLLKQSFQIFNLPQITNASGILG
jgi:hypothetical protein